jgi:hypothetical protein
VQFQDMAVVIDQKTEKVISLNNEVYDLKQSLKQVQEDLDRCNEAALVKEDIENEKWYLEMGYWGWARFSQG